MKYDKVLHGLTFEVRDVTCQDLAPHTTTLDQALFVPVQCCDSIWGLGFICATT